MSLNIDLLERSFELVKGRQEEFSAEFYRNLFADYPSVKPLFANTHLEEQGKKLFASLVLVVNSLRQSEALASSLTGLGARHVKYGVLPQHYPMVGSSLLKTLAWALDSNWNADVDRAWTEAYENVTQMMLDGANYPTEIFNLSHPGR